MEIKRELSNRKVSFLCSLTRDERGKPEKRLTFFCLGGKIEKRRKCFERDYCNHATNER